MEGWQRYVKKLITAVNTVRTRVVYNQRVPHFVRRSLNRKCDQVQAKKYCTDKANSNNPISTDEKSGTGKTKQVNKSNIIATTKKCESISKCDIRNEVQNVIVSNRFEPLCDLVDHQGDIETNSRGVNLLSEQSVIQGVNNTCEHEKSKKNTQNQMVDQVTHE